MYNGFPLWRSNAVCECKPLEKVTRWLLLSQLFKSQPSCLPLYGLGLEPKPTPPASLSSEFVHNCFQFLPRFACTGVASRRTLICYCCCCGVVELLEWYICFLLLLLLVFCEELLCLRFIEKNTLCTLSKLSLENLPAIASKQSLFLFLTFHISCCQLFVTTKMHVIWQ